MDIKTGRTEGFSINEDKIALEFPHQNLHARNLHRYKTKSNPMTH